VPKDDAKYAAADMASLVSRRLCNLKVPEASCRSEFIFLDPQDLPDECLGISKVRSMSLERHAAWLSRKAISPG